MSAILEEVTENKLRYKLFETCGCSNDSDFSDGNI